MRLSLPLLRSTGRHRKPQLPRLRTSLSPSSKSWLKRQTLDPYSVRNSQPAPARLVVSRAEDAGLSDLPGVVGGGGAKKSSASSRALPPTLPIISRAQHKIPYLIPSTSRYSSVLDVGCRPFSWSFHVFHTNLTRSGRIKAVDLLPGSVPVSLSSSSRFEFVQGDALAMRVEGEAFDLVMSDASPNRTGAGRDDAVRQNRLTMDVIRHVAGGLRVGGDMVVKVLGGGGIEEVKGWGEVKGRWAGGWKFVRPRGVSRGKEGYYVGRGWRGGEGECNEI